MHFRLCYVSDMMLIRQRSMVVMSEAEAISEMAFSDQTGHTPFF